MYIITSYASCLSSGYANIFACSLVSQTRVFLVTNKTALFICDDEIFNTSYNNLTFCGSSIAL